MAMDSISISDQISILGLIVAAAGVWFVVKQLNESKLASYASTYLQLHAQSQDLHEDFDLLNKFEEKTDLSNMTPEEQKKALIEAPDSATKILGLFETIGILVKNKGLDLQMAYDYWGYYVLRYYKWWEPAKEVNRAMSEGAEEAWEHFEWLAKEFSKLKKN